MYDIGVALRRFRPLIKWYARHYANPHFYHMTKEDLESEGLLTLVKCCQKFPEGQVHFARYFKRALGSRFRKVIRYGNFKMRAGQEVDLEEANSLHPIPNPFLELLDVLQTRIKTITPYLSPDSARLLQMLTDPNNKEVSHQAYMEWCRRLKLRSLGIPTPRCARFRTHQRHIRRALCMSPSQMTAAIAEIQHMNQHLSGRKVDG